jgi:hypothetical protein
VVNVTYVAGIKQFTSTSGFPVSRSASVIAVCRVGFISSVETVSTVANKTLR